MREKMRSARKSYQQNGWVSVRGGFAARKCRILDASETGARLLLDDPNFMTGPFRLRLSRSDEGRDCKLVWQRGREVGAAFL